MAASHIQKTQHSKHTVFHSHFSMAKETEMRRKEKKKYKKMNLIGDLSHYQINLYGFIWVCIFVPHQIYVIGRQCFFSFSAVLSRDRTPPATVAEQALPIERWSRYIKLRLTDWLTEPTDAKHCSLHFLVSFLFRIQFTICYIFRRKSNLIFVVLPRFI